MVHITLILFLYALSSSPDSRIIDVLHLRDRDKSQTCHVVVQRLFFCNSQPHLMDDRVNLSVVLNLILGLKVDRNIDRRRLCDGVSTGKVSPAMGLSPRVERANSRRRRDSRVLHDLAQLAERESNQVGFDGQICPIPSSFPLDILPICPAGKAFGLEKICYVKTALAPAGECIFDRFWCDFAQQDTNLASESAPKDAKMHHRRAIRFDSRSASLQSSVLSSVFIVTKKDNRPRRPI